MNVKRWLATIVVVGLVIAVATPAWAQGNSGGKGKKTKTSCDEAQYPGTTVQFMLPEHLWGSEIVIHPPIYVAYDDSPGSVSLSVTFSNGFIREVVAPLALDFSEKYDQDGQLIAGGGHYFELHGVDVAIVEARLFLTTYLNNNNFDPAMEEDTTTLEQPECGMLGMVVEDSTSYVARLGILWYEKGGDPVPYGEDSDQQWVLRHKPTDIFDNRPTYLNVERTDRTTWVLTSRPDSILPAWEPDCPSCLLPHFASLQGGGGIGRGKKRIPEIWSTPIMPIKIVIRANCEGVDDPDSFCKLLAPGETG